MNIPIEPSATKASEVVVPTSRYYKGVVIYYGEQRKLTFETYLRTPYVPVGDESVMLITKGVEYRPDLVSFQVYGFPDGWWKILEANQMHDIFDFKAGKTIILPNMSL